MCICWILFTSRSDSCIFKLPFHSSLSGRLICILVNLNDPCHSLWHPPLTWHVVPSGLQLLITPVLGNSRHYKCKNGGYFGDTKTGVCGIGDHIQNQSNSIPYWIKQWRFRRKYMLDLIFPHLFLQADFKVRCAKLLVNEWIDLQELERGSVVNWLVHLCWIDLNSHMKCWGSKARMHLKPQMRVSNAHRLHFQRGLSTYLPHILTLYEAVPDQQMLSMIFCLTCSLVSLQTYRIAFCASSLTCAYVSNTLFWLPSLCFGPSTPWWIILFIWSRFIKLLLLKGFHKKTEKVSDNMRSRTDTLNYHHNFCNLN